MHAAPLPTPGLAARAGLLHEVHTRHDVQRIRPEVHVADVRGRVVVVPSAPEPRAHLQKLPQGDP